MKIEEILVHKNICVMGIGNVFQSYREWLEERFRIRYMTNSVSTVASRYPEYTYIPPERLHEIEDLFVIVTASFRNFATITQQLTVQGISHCFIRSVEGASDYPVVPLAALCGEAYTDHLGNTIELGDGVSFSSNAYVHWGRAGEYGQHPIQARNNRLSVGEGTTSGRADGTCVIEFTGRGSSIEIGERNWFGRMGFYVGENSRLRTGHACTFEGIGAIVHDGYVVIGNDCMFSTGIVLRQTDAHPIFDAATGVRLNAGKNIDIGNHVWCGSDATLLGGTAIGDDSIVGAKSVTSGRFPGNVIIAGNPARITREGIAWRKDRLIYSAPIAHISECKSKT